MKSQTGKQVIKDVEYHMMCVKLNESFYSRDNLRHFYFTARDKFLLVIGRMNEKQPR